MVCGWGGTVMVWRSLAPDGSVMASALAILGVMTAATSIRNVDVLTIDCYERLAIGQRLQSGDVYKTTKVSTLQDCQILCTEQKEKCRAFNYGVSVKGNGSCEISGKIVKETADLKPIGTVNDAEYDLYIKKIGCKLVIEKSKDSPSTDIKHVNSNDTHSINKTKNSISDGYYYDKPPYSTFDDLHESSSGHERPPYGFMYAPNFYGPPMRVSSGLIAVRPELPADDGSNKNHYLDEGKKYLPPKGNYPSTGGYGETGNSLDLEPPHYDKLPPIYASFMHHPPNYYEESNYQDSGHFSASYGFSDSQRPQQPEHDYRLPWKRPEYPSDFNRPLDYDKRWDEVPNSLDHAKPFPERPERPLDYEQGKRPNWGDYDNVRDRPLNYQPGKRPNWSPGEDDDRRRRPYPNHEGPGPSNYDHAKRPIWERNDSGKRPYPDHQGPIPDGEKRPAFDDRRPYPDRPGDLTRPLDFDREKRPPWDKSGDGRRPYHDQQPLPGDLTRPFDFDKEKRPTWDKNDDDRRIPYPGRTPLPGEFSRPLGFDRKPGPTWDKSDDGRRPYPDRQAAPGDLSRPLGYDHEERPNWHKGDDGRRPYPDRHPTPGDSGRPLDFDHEKRPSWDKSDDQRGRPYPNRRRPGSDSKRPLDYDDQRRPYYPSSSSFDDRPFRRPDEGNDRPDDYDYYDRNDKYPPPPNHYYYIKDNEYIYGDRKANSTIGRPINGTNPYVPPVSNATVVDESIAKNYTANNVTVLHFPNGTVVSQTIGPNGETITSIITELESVCFMRALSNKRVTHFIVRTLTCETLDDCRQECTTEKSFVCEGFNYRFTRGKGICELLDRPLSVMDYRKCVVYDPETDYYERDRNGDSGCKGRRPAGGYTPSSGSYTPSTSGGYYPSSEGGSYHPYGPSGGGESYYPYGPSGGGGSYYPQGSSGGGGSYYPQGTSGGGGGYYPYGGSGGGSQYPYGSSGGGYYEYSGGGNRRNGYYGGYGTGGGSGRYPTDWSGSKNCKGCTDRGYGYDDGSPGRRPSSGGLYDDGYGQQGNKYGDYSYHQSHHSQSFHQDYHYTDRDDDYYDRRHYQHRHQPAPYLPNRRPSYDYRSYEPYLPPDSKYGSWPYYNDDNYYRDREKDRDFWGYNKKGYTWGSYGRPVPSYDNIYNHNRNNNRYDYDDSKIYYLPTKPEGSKKWGLYGDSYGTGGNSYYNNYWDFNKQSNHHYFNSDKKYYDYGELPPLKPQSIGDGSYWPTVIKDHPRRIFQYLPQNTNTLDTLGSHKQYIPSNKRPTGYDFLKEECSLRSATGFKLRRPIVKKVLSVPNIYECEAFCFAEKEFRCGSYAFRYTLSPLTPSDNCYLSTKDYKQLDNYIDLEPDRDYDIYTMNNLARCKQPLINRKVESECFWRVRSSYRFDSSIVRESLKVNTIVECQIQCLKSSLYTCRAFSFRYGPRAIGGTTENCQLTDWPYYDIDYRTQLLPEPGFELYERGSFGYGCEPDHFGIRGKPNKAPQLQDNQLCYIGFGSPARLLPQAIVKSLFAESELECKTACSRSREETLLQCMSFSYRATAPKGTSNCDLSNIYQRDLLSGVDYVPDPDSWLFAWDDLNPHCSIDGRSPGHSAIPGHTGGGNKGGQKEDLQEGRQGLDIFRPLDTWRVYSVSGWPCRRGTGCIQNKVAGFWFCELEGGDENSWDYCCRPDHHCGHSQGFRYSWCYVGPERTQWRKCSDKYYPYFANFIDRDDRPSRPYLPNSYEEVPLGQGSNSVVQLRPGYRPDRPEVTAHTGSTHQQPTLDQYEEQFDDQFLDPPKPGGLGQARHWPVSYLHKEMPPGANASQYERKDEKPKYAAIQNLIDIIKSNDLKNVKYQITNDSNRADDVLFVKIPLPTNFSQETRTEKTQKLDSEFHVLIPESTKVANLTVLSSKVENSQAVLPSSNGRSLPIYRRSYIERTNITSRGRQLKVYNE